MTAQSWHGTGWLRRDAGSPPDTGADPGPRTSSRAGRIVRNTASEVLITLFCIFVPLSLLTVWVHDIAAWLQSQGLPPRVGAAVKSLGPQLDDAVDGVVHKAATRVVQGPAFETVWTDANRAAHNAIVHALTGQGRGAVGVSDGTVALDVGTAVENVKKDLVDAGLGPAAEIPEVNKQLVLFQSDRLGKIRKGARLLDIVGNWLPVLAVVIGADGVLLTHRRRRRTPRPRPRPGRRAHHRGPRRRRRPRRLPRRPRRAARQAPRRAERPRAPGRTVRLCR